MRDLHVPDGLRRDGYAVDIAGGVDHEVVLRGAGVDAKDLAGTVEVLDGEVVAGAERRIGLEPPVVGRETAGGGIGEGDAGVVFLELDRGGVEGFGARAVIADAEIAGDRVMPGQHRAGRGGQGGDGKGEGGKANGRHGGTRGLLQFHDGRTGRQKGKATRADRMALKQDAIVRNGAKAR